VEDLDFIGPVQIAHERLCESRVSAFGFDLFANGRMQYVLQCPAGIRLPVILCDHGFNLHPAVHGFCGFA